VKTAGGSIQLAGAGGGAVGVNLGGQLLADFATHMVGTSIQPVKRQPTNAHSCLMWR
jgi:hypothetical protein